MALSFRPARAEDLERLVTIHSSAYPDERGRDARLRNFAANPLGSLEDLWVAEDGTAIVAHAFLFGLEVWFGRRRVPVGGVATVGVAPEARGRGVGSALVAHLHDVGRSRGQALTLLYPFQQGFYARLGYATTSSCRHLRFAPRALALSKPELALRAAVGTDRAAIAACWEESASVRTGMLVRSERAWDAWLANESRTWLVAEGPRGVEGYIAWTLAQPDPYGATTLTVREMAARSDRAVRSLWAAVATQRDQVTEVCADVAEDDPVDRALLDANRAPSDRPSEAPHAFGALAPGPMLRMTDVSVALAARGWLRSGRLVVAVDEELVEVAARDGQAVARAATAEADIRTDRRVLGAIAFGGLRASHAARLGWLTARDERALAAADALFALPAYFSPERF